MELCRWVYNETLALRKNAWESEQKNIGYYDSKKMIPIWKKDKPELKTIHSQVLQEIVKRVDLAFQAFFRRVKTGEKAGYPRFKGYGRYDSITYTQSGFELKDNKLWLSKIGEIKIKLHRSFDGEIQRLNIRKVPTGKWYVSFLIKSESESALPKTGLSIGIDVGISSFLTFSDGQHIPNPRFFVTEEKNLAKAQRKLSKAEKGTPERKKALKVVQHIHERISNKREDFVHKISLNLVKEFDVITFEDLNIKNMVKNHNLAKYIADVAWNKLITITSYKAEWADKWVEFVNPKYTSQMCSGCGEIVGKSLSERVHNRPYCELILNRDHNAAINILRWDCNLFVKPIDAPHFNEGSNHCSQLLCAAGLPLFQVSKAPRNRGSRGSLLGNSTFAQNQCSGKIESKLDKAFIVFLILSIILSVATLVYVIIIPKKRKNFKIYMLGCQQTAELQLCRNWTRVRRNLEIEFQSKK